MDQSYHKYIWTYQSRDGKLIPQSDMTIKEVLAREKEGHLAMFHLSSAKKTLAVDLITGLFYIGGFPFDPAPGITQKNHNYRLVFYMRPRKTLTFGG